MTDDTTPTSATFRRRPVVWAALAVVIALVGAGIGLGLSRGSAGGVRIGPESVPLQEVPNLAPASTTASGNPVDGITCRGSNDQVVRYHIHVLLELYMDGKQERVPAGVGIPAPQNVEHLSSGLFIDNGLVGGCLYWLHVHADDGIIHVESPYRHAFTLGQFFDIWGQPLTSGQVGPAKGVVTTFENGQRFAGDPRNVPLLRQGVIQLDVGTPIVPFHPKTFHVKGLCGDGTAACTSKG